MIWRWVIVDMAACLRVGCATVKRNEFERSPAVTKCERSPAVTKCERSPAVTKWSGLAHAMFVG